MTTKAIFQMKRKYIFVKIFGKTVSKCIALFRLRSLPARKRRKVSLNIGDLRCFCLLFSTTERFAVGISSRAAFNLFVVARVGTVFPQFFWSKQLVRSCWSASIRTNISLNTFLQNNFSIVYFLRKRVLGVFSHVFSFLFSFSGLWNECEVVPMLMLSLRSDIQVQAFQKDAIEF